MSAPLLSVVVPAYRNAATIAETLRSVLAERDVDLELIVADHASPDGTRAVVEGFQDDPRLTLLDTPTGGGAARNWQRVTDAARGTHVKLVCGDDLVRPGALARQVRLLETSGAVLAAGRRDVTDAAGRTVFAGWGLSGLSGEMPGDDVIRRAVRIGTNPLGEPASVTMRRDALADAGGWNAAFSYYIDFASYAGVLRRGGFVADPEVAATFRMSDAQWSVALARTQAAEARRFHRWVRDTMPGVVSPVDILRGDVRATGMAYARRLAYVLLRRRMR